MRVYKDTPFEFSYMPWEIHPPEVSLMIVVKGAFDLVHRSTATISEEQVPANGPVPHEEGGDEPSLRLETDYAVVKPRAEWYLAGTARAPLGRAVTMVPVRVRVGELSKELVVWGDRAWKRSVVGASPTEPIPFESMPLCWERAFGGAGFASNPVGRGLHPMEIDGQPVHPLPNIESPGKPLLGKSDRPEPAGMFPIPGTWPERIRKTGTYTGDWKEERWPWFPRDFEYGFFNCAPADQQRDGHWRGDELIELHGLDAEYARLQTRLPGLRARCFVQWVDPARLERERPDQGMSEREALERAGPPPLTDVPLHLDTIVVDADVRKAVCAWRGLVKVGDDQLSDIARLFFVHEPIDADHPIEHYEAWLWREVLAEADDVTGADEEPEDEPPEVDAPTPPTVLDADEVEQIRRDLPRLVEDIHAAVGAMLPEERLPPAADVRRALEERGHEVPDELVDAEPMHAPLEEVERPSSLVRLEAIVRRRRRPSFVEEDLSGHRYRGLDLRGCDFSGALLLDVDLAGADLRESRLDGALLLRATLEDADLRGASLVGADLTGARADRARFDGGQLDEAMATHGSFVRATFHGASMRDVELIGCDMTECDLRSIQADGLDVSDSRLDGSSFAASTLRDAVFHGASCRGVIFERCSLTDVRASEGTDFTDARLVLVDAPGAQLQRTILEGASFAGSNLPGADLSESRARGATFVRAVLRGACLDRCVLERATFAQADLVEASFERSDLRGADFRGAMMFGAGLWRAITLGAQMEGANVERTLAEDA